MRHKCEKGVVEISEVRSLILEKCAFDIFRTAHQYLRGAHWFFFLEVHIELWKVRTDRYQRSVGFCKLQTDLWEIPIDSDIWEVRTGLWDIHSDIQDAVKYIKYIL